MQHLRDDEITAYIDGECTDVEHRHVRDHIAHCADCRRKTDDQMQIKNLLGSLVEPEIPRAFTLPDSYGEISAPHVNTEIVRIASPGVGKITRLEPVLRFISIAAVIAFLVMGGAQLAGVGDAGSNSDSSQITLTETDSQSSALDSQETTIARGEVRAQGESAAAGAGPLTAQHPLGDTAAQASTSLTLIEITTIGVGIVALTSIASWILIRYRAGVTSHQM